MTPEKAALRAGLGALVAAHQPKEPTMAEHPPEYEYRVADLHDSTFSHPCGDDHEFAMIAAQRARALGRFGAQIQRRFMGPWHAMCDGDEVPAEDRQQAVFE